jgi:hypothetical protein
MPDSVSADSLHLLRLTATERTRLLRRVPRGVEIYRAPQQILTDNGKVFTGRSIKPRWRCSLMRSASVHHRHPRDDTSGGGYFLPNTRSNMAVSP